MSLVVWLPLNGDSKNQGTKQYKETINTLEYTSNGKTTNKCMNLGRLQYDKNPLGMVGSICFWIYPKSTDEGGNGKSQIIFGRNDLGTGERKWSLYMFPNNKSLHSWGCQKDGSKNPNGDFTLTGVLKESAWNHVCVAHDLDYEYVYINGALKRKIKWDSNGTFTFDIGTPIIFGDFYNDEANYRLNDFRIYDHCLTQSEVSEIAKGLMLHYSFENPYVTETTNIPHSLIEESSEVTFGNDSTGDYVIRNGMTSWSGLTINRISVKPGRYYTWSMEVMSIKDIEYVIDGNMECSNSSHASSNDMHFDIIRGYSHINHKLDDSDTLPKGKLEAYKWTRIYFTVKVKQDCTNPKLFHTFVPYIPSGDSSVKVYYRNSQLEEKPYDTPYTPSNREAGLIRDNSGMGNDGTQVYQRIEIPIESITPTSAQNLTDTISNGTHTIKGFNGTANQCIYFGKIKYNSLYHYVGSTVCYEFDLKVTDMTTVSGQTPRLYLQGTTNLNDGTSTWYENPIPNDNLYKRINNGKNGTYHICLQKKITVAAGVTNVISYGFGVRFDYIKSGTITISNVHAYYDDLDTSTLSLSDNSAIGTHSAYFNGKNYINAGVVTPDYMDELTVSCWIYRDDWTKITKLPQYSSIMGNRDIGGFAFNIDANQKIINFCTINNSNDYNYAGGFDMSTFTSGWHLLTGVATKNKISIYIDGKLHKENQHNQNISINNLYNNTTNKVPFIIGSEIDNWNKTPNYTNIIDFYIDDIRLYPTALSPEDIKALYNVKTKIDNKSNLYCNQLVETKSENLVSDLSEMTDIGNFRCTCSVSYDKNNKISTFTVITKPTEGYSGPYILNKYYGGSLITNETYKYSIYVKLPKSGSWKIGEERIINSSSSPHHNGHSYEAGKWYKIENEGPAVAGQVNFIFYYQSGLLEVGDEIQVRDFQMYRLYDENYNPGPNVKGQYKTFELNEIFNEDIENSGATIVDKYGAEWLEVFYHNNNNGTIYFANETEALHTNSQYKFSILDQLENFRGTDNKFEFLLEYPTDLPNQYLRWKQADNPVETIDTSSKNYDSTAFVNGYELIHTDWNDSFEWSGLISNNNNRSLLDGVVGTNWWYSICSYNSYTESGVTGVPGPRQNTRGIIIQNDIHLYVRIDNLPNRNEIFRQYKRQTKTKEIIEI